MDRKKQLVSRRWADWEIRKWSLPCRTVGKFYSCDVKVMGGISDRHKRRGETAKQLLRHHKYLQSPGCFRASVQFWVPWIIKRTFTVNWKSVTLPCLQISCISSGEGQFPNRSLNSVQCCQCCNGKFISYRTLKLTNHLKWRYNK